MLFFAKLKMGIIVGLCIFLPVSAIVIAENRSNNVALNENIIQNKKVSNTVNNTKPIVVKEVEKEPVPEVKKEIIIEPKVEIVAEPKKEINYFGIWKLKAKSANYPHKIDSTLTIKENGTFILTQPNAVGKYLVKDGIFSFNFGGMIMSFKFNLEEKSLTFDFVSGGMNMKYERSEK